MVDKVTGNMYSMLRLGFKYKRWCQDNCTFLGIQIGIRNLSSRAKKVFGKQLDCFLVGVDKIVRMRDSLLQAV